MTDKGTLDEVDLNELELRSLTHEELEDMDAAEPEPVEVTFSTQDFDISGLVRRLDSNSMLVPQFGNEDDRITTAGFQRGFVWKKSQMDRFIESLLLGYPVPGIFLVKQAEDNRLLVLDGQQRLRTLQWFYGNTYLGRPFELVNVGDSLKSLTYRTLPEDMQRLLDDSYMQATIVSADGSPETNDAIYQIFERLNSGGTQLTPHEIRVALYAGPFIDYLESLNQDLSWRRLYGPRSARIRDQELVLRILALYTDSQLYTRPQKTFLNNFTSRNRNNVTSVQAAGQLFLSASTVLLEAVGPEALRRLGSRQVNTAQTEAVYVGLMRALAANRVVRDLQGAVESLKRSADFQTVTGRATADNEVVRDRLSIATKELALPR